MVCKICERRRRLTRERVRKFRIKQRSSKMIHKVFTVYDTATGSYMRPFFDVARGAALRGFADIVSDTNSAIGKHPQDFTLFEIGEFDYGTGKFTTYDAPVSLGCAIEFLPQ